MRKRFLNARERWRFWSRCGYQMLGKAVFFWCLARKFPSKNAISLPWKDYSSLSIVHAWLALLTLALPANPSHTHFAHHTKSSCALVGSIIFADVLEMCVCMCVVHSGDPFWCAKIFITARWKRLSYGRLTLFKISENTFAFDSHFIQSLSERSLEVMIFHNLRSWLTLSFLQILLICRHLKVLVFRVKCTTSNRVVKLPDLLT